MGEGSKRPVGGSDAFWRHRVYPNNFVVQCSMAWCLLRMRVTHDAAWRHIVSVLMYLLQCIGDGVDCGRRCHTQPHTLGGIRRKRINWSEKHTKNRLSRNVLVDQAKLLISLVFAAADR